MKTRIFTFGLGILLSALTISSRSGAQCCVAPANLTVKSLGRTEADLQWQRIKQASCTTPVKYKVQYRQLGTTAWTSVIVRTKRDDKFGDTTIKGLTPATTYQWRVQGICSTTSKTAFIDGPNFTTLAAAAVTVSSSSSSLQEKLTITAYPNPVNSELKVSGHLKAGGLIDVQIVNSTGQVVARHSYNFNSGDFSASIDVSKLPTGVYIVVVDNKGEKATLNILKQ